DSADLAGQLARTIPVTAPPTGLPERVLAEAVLPRGVVALVRGANRKWQATPFAGVSIARLFEDHSRGELTSLVRIMPGACYPAHHHAILELGNWCVGDLVFED